MRVAYIDDPNDQKWMGFVSSQKSQASIFHHPAWLHTLAATYGYRPFVIAVMEDEAIKTGIPFMEIRSPLSSRRWISLPFTDYCHPLGGSSSNWNTIQTELTRVVYDGKVPMIEVRWDMPNESAYQTQKNVLHTLKLDQDYESIRRNFHRMHRKNIKKAIRKDVEILAGEEMEHLRIFYDIHIKTRKRHGIPTQPWRFFENVQKYLLANGLGYVMLARYKGEWIAGGVFLYYGSTLTYKYTASVEDTLDLRPNNLIYDKAIQWGIDHDFSIIDMGKSSCDNQGLRNFKSRWGATEVPLKYTFYSRKQSKNFELREKLLPLLQVGLQNSPIVMTRVLGELLYRYFP